MDINAVVNKVVNLVKSFHKEDKSFFTLVMESGYIEIHEQISEDIILNMVEAQPACIDEWVGFSQDQRITEGWYLANKDGKNVVVRFFDKSEQTPVVKEYPTMAAACAAFIKHQIEFSRELALSDLLRKKNKGRK